MCINIKCINNYELKTTIDGNKQKKGKEKTADSQIVNEVCFGYSPPPPPKTTIFTQWHAQQ